MRQGCSAFTGTFSETRAPAAVLKEELILDKPDIYAQPRHIASLEECLFYHHMELPGVGEVGSGWDLRKTVDQYLGNLDFSGKRVLDVGTASGFLTFSMEARGAEVVSFDVSDPSDLNYVPYQHPRFPAERVRRDHMAVTPKIANAYWYAHRALGSKAKVFYGNVNDLPDALGRFDIVVVGMILPHLRDPFQALYSASRRCSDTLVVTQQASPLGALPSAQFMPNIRLDPNNIEHYLYWWGLSERCLINMLEVLGFGIVSAVRGMHRCTSVSRGGDMREECLTLVARRNRLGQASEVTSEGTRTAGRLERWVGRLDQIDIRWFLTANTACALLLLAVEGGGLVLARLSGVVTGAPPGAYVAALAAMAAFGLAGMVSSAYAVRVWALKAHCLLFVGFAAYLTYHSTLIVAGGARSGTPLSSDPLLFMAIAAYSVYLARRLFLPEKALRNPLLMYSHVAALAIAAVISALVLWRAYSGAA
jgi:methyltransferase family protein